ncbi:hypothetical protein [Geodermatophilus sp. URMC 63]
MSTGEWVQAAEPPAVPDPGDVVLPWWLVVLFAVLAAVEPFIGAYLGHRAAMKQVEATNKATEATAEAAARTAAIEQKKSDRELILRAMELARSSDMTTKRQGYAMLQGLSKMPGLSLDDAILLQGLSRMLNERTLSMGRQAEELEGEEVEYYVEFFGDEGEEDDDDEADQGHR